jgi:hypothetical protein
MKIALLILFSTTFLISFSQVNLSNGLVAYYPFGGNANDASGNGNDAVFNNATLTIDRFGNPNSAYYFNGIDNYIQIPNAPGLNPSNQISICAFVKPMGFYQGPCHGNSVLMKGDGDYLPGNYLLRFDDNAYTYQNNCNTSVVDTIHQNFYGPSSQTSSPGYTPYINKDQWYCLVYTNDGKTSKFYIDNVLINTQAVSAPSFINSYDLFLGRLNNSSFPYWFNGALDEVRIYNRAINDQEVAALCPSSALPLIITNFEANVYDSYIKLIWTTENENGILNYSVERSETGNSDFIKIGNINSTNSNSYFFIDSSANLNQNYYYRLAIQDKTNTVSYSEIKTARIVSRLDPIFVFPNPSSGIIMVKINGYIGESQLILANSNGQIIWKKNYTILDNLPIVIGTIRESAGIYYLTLKTKSNNFIQKIIIY